ncbi:MAG: hypothetical protein EPN93_08625 [Spirochaetes bacterium]|nr:MAG: hypothetical protein EPN93_08625 [Spirochaetota bacterium]
MWIRSAGYPRDEPPEGEGGWGMKDMKEGQGMIGSHELSDFLVYVRRLGLAAKTYKNYEQTLTDFLRFTWEEYPDLKDITEITRETIRSYENHLLSAPGYRKKPLTKERRARYCMNIRVFFRFLEREERVYRNPASNIAIPRRRNPLIKDVLTVEEMDTLLKAAAGETFQGLRDRAILELLYSTGIRSEELCGIQMGDIDLTEKLLVVRKGKFGKERVVPFGESAKYWVSRYVERVRGLLGAGNNDRLFVSLRGKNLTVSMLWRIVKRAMRTAGIEKNVTAHTFRHSCATHMLKGRADIRYVQKQLGHESISSTERYLKIEIADLKEVHERCHPREREDW